MELIIRQVERFHEFFARAVDQESMAQEPLNIYFNNPNFNNQSGSGIVTNNNHNITTVYNTGPLKGEARSPHKVAIQTKIAEGKQPSQYS